MTKENKKYTNKLQDEIIRLMAKIEKRDKELLTEFLDHYNDRVVYEKRINYDEIEIFLEGD